MKTLLFVLLTCGLPAIVMADPSGTAVRDRDPAGGLPAAGTVQAEMNAAAERLAGTLEGARAEQALHPFRGETRRDWSYLPGTRPGLPLMEMNAAQRRLTHELLRTLLSTSGYLKVTGVISLEEVLRAMERRGFLRSSEAYFLALFGRPGDGLPWGWRFEGHHLSLHVTSLPGSGLAVTPLFLGANPAEILHGPRAGTRVLATEEDLARSLVNDLDPALRQRAVISPEAPRDILTRSDPAARRLSPEGLPAAEMTAGQRALLLRLVQEYLGNLAPRLAAEEMGRIRRRGLEQLTFAWAGGTEPSQGHYYRIQGSSLLIEYDNTQNDANHVHAVWRDLERDFGGDLLQKHYMKSGHHHAPSGRLHLAAGPPSERHP